MMPSANVFQYSVEVTHECSQFPRCRVVLREHALKVREDYVEVLVLRVPYEFLDFSVDPVQVHVRRLEKKDFVHSTGNARFEKFGEESADYEELSSGVASHSLGSRSVEGSGSVPRRTSPSSLRSRSLGRVAPGSLTVPSS